MASFCFSWTSARSQDLRLRLMRHSAKKKSGYLNPMALFPVLSATENMHSGRQVWWMPLSGGQIFSANGRTGQQRAADLEFSNWQLHGCRHLTIWCLESLDKTIPGRDLEKVVMALLLLTGYLMPTDNCASVSHLPLSLRTSREASSLEACCVFCPTA